MGKRRSKRMQAADESTVLAGISIRVSMDKRAHKVGGRQMAEDIESPSTQEDRGRFYCASQNWTVAMVESDIDESAYRQHYSQRKGLMRLLEAMDRGEIQKLVVYKFNRLSRRLGEFIEICDRVETKGGAVVSVSEQVDTSTNHGRLIRNIMASFAQYQSEEISDHVYQTWVTKAKRGERPPGRPPYGTNLVKGMLVPDPKTHDNLVAIYQTFCDTVSVAAVVDYLNERRVPTTLPNRKWGLVTVRRILSNPAYIGQIELNEDTYSGRWEPLVPLELWEQAQQILNTRRSPALDRIDAHLLRGYVICSQCGRSMWTHYEKRWVNRKLARDRFYWCADPHTLRDGCDMPALHAEELESTVWSWLQFLARDSRLESLARGAHVRHRPDANAHRRVQLEREQERAELQIRQLFELLADASITREQFRLQNKEYTERLATIRQSLEEFASSEVPLTPERIQRGISTVLQAGTTSERRAALSALDVTLEVSWKAVHLLVGGFRIRLKGRLLGERWYFGKEYNRLDYQGTMLTDKQIKFVQRTYAWADKRDIAKRLGRSYGALKRIAARLRGKGLTVGRSYSRKDSGEETTDTSQTH